MPALSKASFAFGLIVVVVSTVFVWSIWEFLGAVLWSLVAAIMFWPLNNRLLDLLPGRKNLATILTLIVVIGVGVLPTVVLSMFMLDKAGAFYAGIESGQIDMPAAFERLQGVLPGWATGLMQRTGITDLDSLGEQLSIGCCQTNANSSLTDGVPSLRAGA